jgi:signal transduction histidine kinase
MRVLLVEYQHPPFPEVAAALRSQIDDITAAWVRAVHEKIPEMRRLSFDETKDSVPTILATIANTLSSANPESLQSLLDASPNQGLTRFDQDYDFTQTLHEDRLLRAVVVQQTEAALGRQLTSREAAALHVALDLMLQQAVVAIVTKQNEQIRSAAESQLKYLSFLSHDLSNQLYSVTLTLELLKHQIRATPGLETAGQTLQDAQQSIQQTMTGMKRLLDHERLRKDDSARTRAPVDLHALVQTAARLATQSLENKNQRLLIDAPPQCILHTDEELLAMVLQNLLGNAIKFTQPGGTIHIQITHDPDSKHPCVIAVTDNGPGIAPDQMQRIFEAFRRGEIHGQEGVGLGLAIVSQAVKLLGGEITLESKLGAGSTFQVALPA